MGFTPGGFLGPRIKDTNPRRAGNHMRHLRGSMRLAPEPLGVGEGDESTGVLAESEKAVGGPEPLPPS